jgi:hypothetical protein
MVLIKGSNAQKLNEIVAALMVQSETDSLSVDKSS